MNKETIISDLLIRQGVVASGAMAQARIVQLSRAISLPQALIALGLADEESITTAVARELRLDTISSPLPPMDPTAASLLPAEFCRQRKVAPLSVAGRMLRLAMADPLDYFTIQDVEFRTRKQVICVAAAPATLEILLTNFYGDAGVQAFAPGTEGASLQPEGSPDSEEHPDLARESVLAANANIPPIIQLVNQILSRAVKAGASDIHVEPRENALFVRQRVDGNLQEQCRLPKDMQDATISRLKIMANMDIADRLRPQDGRSRLTYKGKRVDLRVSTLPTQYGEKVVLRILDSSSSQIPMERLGLSPENLRALQGLLSLPQGMLLVTGPTGSGKTTTLYTALNWIKSAENNVITVEDPIEYRLPGINQVQINTKAGITFAAGLRSILRQDPNIIMVGEIRDRETVSIALEAAQTGHLLLSTLHTNNAPATITRLLDLGVESYMAASSLVGILAQRLVRRPCANCAQSKTPSDELIRRLGGETRLPRDAQWIEGKGCEKCGGTGYKGRMAIHELLAVTDELRDMITRREPEHRLRDTARRGGMRTLLEDGVAKAAAGQTTLEEVLQVVAAEEGSREEPCAPETTVGIAGEGLTYAPAVDVRTQEPAPQPAAKSAGKRILIVEDSLTIITVVRYFLELEGFEVKTAANGQEGLLAARRSHPQLIVSDLTMPGMDGIQMIQEIRSDPALPQPAILVLTSDTNVDSEERCLELGADDYMVKPVEPRRLTARIKALLARTEGRPTIHSAA